LQDEDDINQVTDFFSYEHFYVIYCKFWELDKDHDLFIDREDLARHNDHGLRLNDNDNDSDDDHASALDNYHDHAPALDYDLPSLQL
jgi:hypothetical protein